MLEELKISLKKFADTIFQLSKIINPEQPLSSQYVLKDLADYAMFIAASDGYLKDIEVETINYYFDTKFTLEEMMTYINCNKIFSDTFEKTPPQLLIITVMFDNLCFETDEQSSSETIFCHLLLKSYKIIAEEIINCDGVASESELAETNLYLNMIENYINNNLRLPNQINSNHSVQNGIDDISNLSGIEFENICKTLIEKMGFEVETTKASGDGGIDLIAISHQPLFEGTYIIQCKRYSGSVGEPIIRDLYGVVTAYRANKGILITTGSFTKSAIEFAYGKQLELIDGKKLNSLLNKYNNNTTIDTNNNARLKELINGLLIDPENDFELPINSLKKNPDDELTRLKLIQKLLEACELTSTKYYNIFTHQSEKIKVEDRIILFNEAKKHIEIYRKKADKSNIRKKYLIDTLDMFLIQFSIYEGDFLSAVKKYIQLINQKELYVGQGFRKSKDLPNRVISNMYRTIYNIVQIAVISRNDYFINKMYNSGKIIIENMTQLYLDESKINKNIFFKNQYELATKIKEPSAFYFFDSFTIDSFIDYAYFNGNMNGGVDGDEYPILINNDQLYIYIWNSDCVGTINNLKSKLSDAIRFMY